MLMPLLVRLIDSEIKAIDGVVAQVLNSIEDGRGVAEEVTSTGLPIHQEPPSPDLHVEPIHWNAQPDGQFGRVEQVGVMGPP
jgi:hypothetical protein